MHEPHANSPALDRYGLAQSTYLHPHADAAAKRSRPELSTAAAATTERRTNAKRAATAATRTTTKSHKSPLGFERHEPLPGSFLNLLKSVAAEIAAKNSISHDLTVPGLVLLVRDHHEDG